jgi:hypothetical protein
MTDSALGMHVEAGVPLGAIDVDQVWWLVDILEETGLLRPVTTEKKRWLIPNTVGSRW